jgi:TonB family protein
MRFTKLLCILTWMAASTAWAAPVPAYAAAVPDKAEPPVPVTRFPPVYPDEAARRNITGHVKLSAVVDNEGTVESVDILEETPPGMRFAESAQKALEKWIFQAGHPGRYEYNFNFGEQPQSLPPEDGNVNPVPVTRATPAFPPEAYHIISQASAKVTAGISPDGSITGVTIVSEDPVGFGFGRECAASLKAYTFMKGRPGDYTVSCKWNVKW